MHLRKDLLLSNSSNQKPTLGMPLAVQWLKLHLPMLGVRVQPLVRELGDPTCLIAKKYKREQYCDKFDKDFLNDPH